MVTFLSSISNLFENKTGDSDKFSPLPTRLNKRRESIVPADTYVLPATSSSMSPRRCSFDLYGDSTPIHFTPKKNSQSTLKRQKISYPLERKRQIIPFSILFCEESDSAPITFTGEWVSDVMPEDDIKEKEVLTSSSMPSLVSDDDTVSTRSISIYSNANEVEFQDEEEKDSGAFPVDWDDLEITFLSKIDEWPGSLEEAEASIKLVKPCIVDVATEKPVVESEAMSAPDLISASEAILASPAFNSCRRCLHLAHKQIQGCSDIQTQCKRCSSKVAPIAPILDSKARFSARFSQFFNKPMSKARFLTKRTEKPLDIVHLAPLSIDSNGQEYTRTITRQASNASISSSSMSSNCPVLRTRAQIHQTFLRAREERRMEAIRLAQGIPTPYSLIRQPINEYTCYGEEMTVL